MVPLRESPSVGNLEGRGEGADVRPEACHDGVAADEAAARPADDEAESAAVAATAEPETSTVACTAVAEMAAVVSRGGSGTVRVSRAEARGSMT